MDIETERRIIELFEQAMEWPDSIRERRLREVLAGEPPILEAVLAMINADSRSALLPTMPPEPATLREEPVMPTRIGQYRIIEEIGRGGMGLVYRAARDDGLFDQQVAIKVIRRNILSATASEQFANERRILARLHHPHIAQLFDGGFDENSAPYIIMELIAGAPITIYADQKRLDLSARIDLFKQACSAIEFAHRALVVHADVKPSNVVVADGFGVKLLDFGIARLIDDERATHIAHTPGYSSPARIAGVRAVPADDVFALGVLLRALTEGVKGVDADLAAVAEKAADFDIDRRYGAVSELADDIERWRGRRPVSARPPDRWHGLTLFWHRNRIALSFGTAAALLLVATATITTVLYIRANHERVAAEKRFVEIRSLSDFLLSDAVTDLEAMPGSGPLRARIARRAASALDRLSRVTGAPFEVQVETANGYARVGEILSTSDVREMTDPATGDAVLAKAEAALRRLSAQRPDRADFRIALARTLLSRAVFEGTAKIDRPRTLALLDEVQSLLDPLIAAGMASFGAQRARTEADLLRGYVLADAVDYKGSQAVLEAAIDRARRISVHTPRERVEIAMQIERSLTMIGDAKWYSGDKRDAAAFYRRGMAQYDQPGLGTDVRIVKRQLYDAYTVASSIFELGQTQEALAVIRQGLAVGDQLRLFDDTAGARRMATIVREEYANELRAIGDIDQAIVQSNLAVAEFREIAKLQPNNYQSVRSVPAHLRGLGEMYRDIGDTRRACALFLEADTLWTGLAKSNRVAQFDLDNDIAQIKSRLAKCRDHTAGAG